MLFNSNATGVISGAVTTYPSGAHEFIPGISGVQKEKNVNRSDNNITYKWLIIHKILLTR